MKTTTNKPTGKFGLRTILSVTTGLRLTKPTADGGNGIGDMYELLGYMSADSPMTQ